MVATPHLGASTDEAQEKAGIAVARSVRLALAGELVPDAVNVQGGVIAEDVKPGLPLAEKLGRIFTALAGEVAVRLDVEVCGEITQHDVKVLELSALKGVFEDVVDETVSYVNAPLFAQERGVEVRLTTSSESPEHRNVVTVRGTLGRRRARSPSPARWPARSTSRRSSRVGDYDVDLALADHMAFLAYEDRPGVVGTLGRILGEAGINIAGMQVARAAAGGEALVALTVDDTIPQAVLTEIADEIGATSARSVNLVYVRLRGPGHPRGPGPRPCAHTGTRPPGPTGRRRRLPGGSGDRGGGHGPPLNGCPAAADRRWPSRGRGRALTRTVWSPAGSGPRGTRWPRPPCGRRPPAWRGCWRHGRSPSCR